MERTNTIRFSRTEDILESREIAVIKLNQEKFIKGEPRLVYYYTDNTKEFVDCLFVIGTANGVGKYCYRIVNRSTVDFVWGVGTTLPDISQLVNGEVYLWCDTENGNTWNTVELVDNEKSITPITAVPKNYINILDNQLYVSGFDRKVRLVNDIYSTDEIDEMLDRILELQEYRFKNISTAFDVALELGYVGTREEWLASLQGAKGDTGDKGSLDNIICLSETEYRELEYKDPNCIYCVTEDGESEESIDFETHTWEVSEFDGTTAYTMGSIEGTTLII